jgi:hypothetical protein
VEFSEPVKKAFSMLILLTGGLILVEFIMLLAQGNPIVSSEIGAISSTIISILAIQVVITCLVILGIIAPSLFPGKQEVTKVQNVLQLILFVAGIVLAVEGLAAINISSTILGEVAQFAVMLAGLQLFCLGALVISSYIVAGKKINLPADISGYAALSMMLLLLPAAFLIA